MSPELTGGQETALALTSSAAAASIASTFFMESAIGRAVCVLVLETGRRSAEE